jgi:hypothetical protein
MDTTLRVTSDLVVQSQIRDVSVKVCILLVGYDFTVVFGCMTMEEQMNGIETGCIMAALSLMTLHMPAITHNTKE